jgi:hypothetical protein
MTHHELYTLFGVKWEASRITYGGTASTKSKLTVKITILLNKLTVSQLDKKPYASYGKQTFNTVFIHAAPQNHTLKLLNPVNTLTLRIFKFSHYHHPHKYAKVYIVVSFFCMYFSHPNTLHTVIHHPSLQLWFAKPNTWSCRTNYEAPNCAVIFDLSLFLLSWITIFKTAPYSRKPSLNGHTLM